MFDPVVTSLSVGLDPVGLDPVGLDPDGSDEDSGNLDPVKPDNGTSSADLDPVKIGGTPPPDLDPFNNEANNPLPRDLTLLVRNSNLLAISDPV